MAAAFGAAESTTKELADVRIAYGGILDDLSAGDRLSGAQIAELKALRRQLALSERHSLETQEAIIRLGEKALAEDRAVTLRQSHDLVRTDLGAPVLQSREDPSITICPVCAERGLRAPLQPHQRGTQCPSCKFTYQNQANDAPAELPESTMSGR
ncbi:hypothetical protein RM543_12240 [Roseicyclus sp. F158]|uniref:Uncharacterized protein n=1 Tax=Tropicimonas omnivorans TaxID=3075590 RepID=A0ABU3DK17_9RHOB|nr:hypothetical protein [Roseicyclus sp. F158]MDT0683457.1 hypothetical protein [Roseicyclus sp. F158]